MCSVVAVGDLVRPSGSDDVLFARVWVLPVTYRVRVPIKLFHRAKATDMMAAAVIGVGVSLFFSRSMGCILAMYGRS
jgi:hypothetical protein